MMASTSELASSPIDSYANNNDKMNFAFEPVEPNASHHQRLTRQRNAFLVAAIVFLVAFLVILICFIVKASEKPSKSTVVCTSPTCVKVSSAVLSRMDFSANPCEDFFQYACGGWDKENTIPDSASYWNQLTILTLKHQDVLKRLVSDKEGKDKYKDNEAVMKTIRFYHSCMNKSRTSELGAQPMLDLIETLGSWNLSRSGSWNASSWDLMSTLVRSQDYASALFEVEVTADYGNSSRNIIVIDQSGLELTKETYLGNKSDQAKVREAYKTLMVQVVSLLGADEDDAERQMMDVFDFETKLANIYISADKRPNFAENYKRITVKELTDYTGKAMNLKPILEDTFKDYIPITNDTIVSLDQTVLGYLKNLGRLCEDTKIVTLANYIMWRVVWKNIDFLSEDFENAKKEYKKVKIGTQEELPQWRKCLSDTSEEFGMALGRMYVDARFTKDTKMRVVELIDGIRGVFIENLDKVDWMDKKTKDIAIDKARSMSQNIGFPDYIMDHAALAKDYKGYEPSDEFFDNAVRASVYRRQKNLAAITKPTDKNKWFLNPQDVNAYYVVFNNLIAFPAGILQSTFYDQDRPRALNYGSIGVVVGHEITHGFDNNGRRFDKNGNFRENSWSNNSVEAFTNKTKCLVEQYSNYTYLGEHVKGDLTLGENIADNGALKQAFQAYQRVAKQKGHDQLLPGVNATNDQLFFLAFGQVWCGKFRRQEALERLAISRHALPRFRVLGTLSNSEDFARTYNCAPGTRMNPRKKCHVW